MTSEFRIEEFKIRGGNLNGESAFPSVLSVFNLQSSKTVDLDEDDEIYSDIGRIPNIYPYRSQELYDRSLEMQTYTSAVLENEYLRAVFLPELGGRLWSLIDKTKDKELLYRNDCIRFCNLALRNAWFSGGVEWNIGMIGHTPFTCSPLFAGLVYDKNGEPVLRMYEYERIRNVTFQMDFSLPGGSKALLCRMRIVNLNQNTIPMYWWSNIAVPDTSDRRTIVPADKSYFSYWDIVSKTTIPFRNGVDVSYPVNTKISMDFFYNVPIEKQKYIASVDGSGYGLLQTSTRRLIGRKLFVWGQSNGGNTWQHFLTDNAGNYSEIQAGLGRTQYECIPMPPNCAWEWMEAYSPAEIDPETAHGDWESAQKAVKDHLGNLLKYNDLEISLSDTKEDYVFRKAEIFIQGSGYGALENLRRETFGERPISEHLDFGVPGEKEVEWALFLRKHVMPCPAPNSVPKLDLKGKQWSELIGKAVDAEPDNWYLWYSKGLLHMDERNSCAARDCFLKSDGIAPNVWSRYALSAYYLNENNKENAVVMLQSAYSMRPQDVTLARSLCKLLSELDDQEGIISLIENMPDEVSADGRIRYYLAYAYAHSGQISEAEMILYKNGGLVIPTIREGEVSITDLWFYVEKRKAELSGRSVDVNKLVPPDGFDFRMGHEKNQ
ncbi:MAG: DUF5107 domain-containing protein [Saccharofermentanales bacterium]